MLSGGEELRIGDVEIAVMAHAPETPGGGADAPTWSVVSRLVDHRTRGARRATWVALGAAGLALAAVALVLVVGGGDDDRSVPQVVRQLAPSTVLVEALRGDRRTATGTGWVLDAGDGPGGHRGARGQRGRALPRRDRRPGAAGAARRQRAVRGPRAAAGAGRRRRAAHRPRSARAPTSSRARRWSRSATRPAPPPTDEVTSTRGVVSSARTAFRDPSPDVPRYREAVQTDTALNPGFSGGPLADLDGRLVGVNAAARTTGSDGRPLQGQNYAIGIDRARRVLERAAARARRSAGPARRSAIRPRRSCSSAGSRPGSISPARCPAPRPRAPAWAAAARCWPAVDGRPLGPSLASYCAAVAGRPGGQELKLTLARPGGGKPREVTVALA